MAPADVMAAEVKYVRCKACGYVMAASKVRDLCPVCGVKAMMFEPCVEKFSESRRRILGMHLHPMIVHFPQAFAYSQFVLVLAMLALTGKLHQMALSVVTVIAWVLPLLVLASFATGAIDGRARFKKLTAPMLRTKISAGIGFFVLSLAAMVVALMPSWPDGVTLGTLVAVGVGECACAAVLGIVGIELVGPKLPG